MISIKNTENLTGVLISGDFNDLYQLVEALHLITIGEDSDKHTRYYNISTRVLGFCYEIRHAYQGDREMELIDNNFDRDNMGFDSSRIPVENLYYSCRYLYPEMFFVMIALNELILIRIRDIIKTKTIFTIRELLDKRIIWDETISIIRLFQSQFAECIKKIMSPASYSRWQGYMNKHYIDIYDICGNYIDMLNIKYIQLSKENRIKKLPSFAKRIADYKYDREHNIIKQSISDAAEKYKCHPGQIKLKDLNYPEEIEW